jgi:UV DNA damage endonuclease
MNNSIRFGFACMSKIISTKYRTVRLNTFSKQKWYGTIEHNINETDRLINYCIENDFNMIRLSSDIIPLASHEITSNLDWQNKYQLELQLIGQKIKKHDLRVSMHPGQYTVINSLKDEVVQNSIKDLQYHCDVLDLMNVSGDIVLHVGGAYSDKQSAINRFIETYDNLSDSIKSRLVIENDDKIFTITDVLYVADVCNIPVVFDHHHFMCNNNGEKLTDFLMDKIYSTWKNKNRKPKVHISSPKTEKEFRSHHDYINFEYVKEILNLCNDIFDVMVEAKQKDLAVGKLIADVNFENN